jgi:hypothetical protein
LPLFDRSPESRLSRRPLALTLGVLFILGTIVAWFAGHRLQPLPARTVPSAVEQSAEAEVPDVPIPDIGPAPIRPAQPDTSGSGGGNP